MNFVNVCGCSASTFLTEDISTNNTTNIVNGGGGRIQFVTDDPDSLVTNLVGADPPLNAGDTVYIIQDSVVPASLTVFQAGGRIPEAGPDFHITIAYDTDSTTVTFSAGVPGNTYFNFDYTKLS